MRILTYSRTNRFWFVTVSVLALALLLSVNAIGTARQQAQGSEGATDSNQKVAFSIAAKSASVSPATQSIDISLQVVNDTAAKSDKAEVEFFISRTKVASSNDLTGILSNPALPETPSTSLVSVDVAATEARGITTSSATIDTAKLQLPIDSSPAVYPLYAQLTFTDGTTHVAVTPLIWQNATSPTQTPLHTIVPLVLPSTKDGMPSTTALDELTRDGGVLSDNLASAEKYGSTLAIDPELIAQIRALGNRAPAAARTFLEKLSRTTNKTFALQYADADLSAQAQIGFTTPLQPIGFNYISKSESNVDYSAFTYSLSGIAWPRANTVSDFSLNSMRRYGFSTFLLDSENVTVSGATSGTLPDSARAVSMRNSLQSASSQALTAENETERAQGRANLIAQLAFINQSDAASVPLVLGLDRGAAEYRRVSTLLDQLGSLNWLQNAPFETVLSQTASATLVSQGVDTERIDDLRSALLQEPEIDNYSTVLETPSYLIQLQRSRVLGFFATSIGVSSPNYAQITEAYFARDRSTLNGVYVSNESKANLLGAAAQIPLQVSNDLPFTAQVYSETTATNSSVIIEDAKSKVTPIPKKSSVIITVPVQARVSSGNTVLVVKLFSVGGNQIDEAVLPVSIRSSWEAIALSVLGVLVATFFGFGIFRSFRAKRSQSFVPEDDGAGD